MKGEVQIYRNLHRSRKDGGSVYSVRNADGIVEAHESCLTLENCKLRVSDKGNERVRDEERKNVHAYIQGQRGQLQPSAWKFRQMGEPVEITYNPYKHKSFVRVDTGEPIYEAKAVFTNPFKVLAIL
jgi:hypothetical protein